jgi:MFS family permease
VQHEHAIGESERVHGSGQTTGLSGGAGIFLPIMPYLAWPTTWRASAVGVYRLWRDLGYAVGALLAGIVADGFGLRAAMWTVAALTGGSGLVSAFRMSETLHIGEDNVT